MTRGGKREGAGRKPKPFELKSTKFKRSFFIYKWEVEPIKEFIKNMRNKSPTIDLK